MKILKRVAALRFEPFRLARVLATTAIPNDIQQLADKNFALLKTDPHHPSIRFKKVGHLWSARVDLRYRALAKGAYGRSRMVLDWFAEYDKLI